MSKLQSCIPGKHIVTVLLMNVVMTISVIISLSQCPSASCRFNFLSHKEYTSRGGHQGHRKLSEAKYLCYAKFP